MSQGLNWYRDYNSSNDSSTNKSGSSDGGKKSSSSKCGDIVHDAGSSDTVRIEKW